MLTVFVVGITGPQRDEATAVEAAADPSLNSTVDDGSASEVSSSGADVEDLGAATEAEAADIAVDTAGAEVALRRYLELADATYESGGTLVADGLGDVAVGFALGEVQAAALELEANKARLTGSVAVVEVDVERADPAEPVPVSLRACLDTSDLASVDASGRSSASSVSGVARTPHLYGLVNVGGTWRVATHDFPVESTC